MNVDYLLTKDAEKLISLLYDVYLEKRENGKSKACAKQFGGSNLIKEKLLINWSIADIDEICRELNRAGLLNCTYANNTVYLASLSDEGISYLEKRFKNGLKDVIQFLASIGAVLPFPKND